MSSLSAAGADGYYHPAEWDPAKHGSRNKFQGSKGTNQWEKKGLIRFALPYNAICCGCETAIGQGTRFNAKKLEAGKYLTIPIYEFQFHCPGCQELFVIRTDPENRDYKYVSGVRTTSSAKQGSLMDEQSLARDGNIFLDTNPDRPRIGFGSREIGEQDALAALDENRIQEQRAQDLHDELVTLEAKQQTRSDDFSVNQQLRDIARVVRKRRQALLEEGAKYNLPYAILDSGSAGLGNSNETGTITRTSAGKVHVRRTAEQSERVRASAGKVHVRRTAEQSERVRVNIIQRQSWNPHGSSSAVVGAEAASSQSKEGKQSNAVTPNLRMKRGVSAFDALQLPAAKFRVVKRKSK